MHCRNHHCLVVQVRCLTQLTLPQLHVQFLEWHFPQPYLSGQKHQLPPLDCLQEEELLWQCEVDIACVGATFCSFCPAMTEQLGSQETPSLDCPMLAHWSLHEALPQACHFEDDFYIGSLQFWEHLHLFQAMHCSLAGWLQPLLWGGTLQKRVDHRIWFVCVKMEENRSECLQIAIV